MDDIGVGVGPDVIVRISWAEDKEVKDKLKRSRLILGKLIAAQAIVQEKITALENADA